MMSFEPLYNSLFRPDKSKEPADIEKIVEDYPYFSVAHFFRLQQNGINGSPTPSTIAKAALHFNNSLLLNYQLSRKSNQGIGEILEPANEENASNQAFTSVSEPKNSQSGIPPPIIDIGNEVIPGANPSHDKREGNHTNEHRPQEGESPTPVATAEEVKEDELLFEPLHTTDYFASQGIKMSEVVQPTDKLGMQLKSFTQWLKTMKKVHDSKLPEGNEQLDASVNKLAEKSNQETEVVTEAMADAFLAQGKPQKAKDIYLKLSLLNPSKNAYFAAKLEQIK